MSYNLGLVKAHVRRAAEHFGPKHGIKTVYGFGPGSTPGSDHPKGLALDFMTSNKATGDSLVNDLIANRAAFDITYIIWWRQIWHPGRGWVKYTGTNNPHVDHAHVSFGMNPGTGSPTDTIPTVPVGNPLIPDEIEALVQVVKDINTGFQWLSEPNNWRRIGLFFGGLMLVFIAIVKWDNTKELATKAVKYAKQ